MDDTAKILFKEHYVTVMFDKSLNLIEVEWHGAILSRLFKETLEFVLYFIEENRIENFLVNRKEMAKISLADAKWREEDWFPRLLKTSIRNSVSVISDDYYNEVSISNMIEEKDKSLKFVRGSFYSYKEAKEWLKEKIQIEA